MPVRQHMECRHMAQLTEKGADGHGEFDRFHVLYLSLIHICYVKCQYIKDCTTPIWLEKFMIYLQEKYSEKRCIEVPSIIRQITLSDEEAFDKYYELLEDFFQNV